MRLDPDFPQTRWMLASMHIEQGDFDSANEVLDGLKRDLETLQLNWVGFLGANCARVGRFDDANEILDFLLQRTEREYVPGSVLAYVYAALGDQEKTLYWLEVAYEQRDFALYWLREYPGFFALRGNPRFQELVDRVNFPVRNRSEE